MMRVMRLIRDTSYWLGVVALVLSVLIRIVPALAMRSPVTPRGGLILAGCLFLCALASRGQLQAE